MVGAAASNSSLLGSSIGFVSVAFGYFCGASVGVMGWSRWFADAAAGFLGWYSLEG